MSEPRERSQEGVGIMSVWRCWVELDDEEGEKTCRGSIVAGEVDAGTAGGGA